MRYPKVCSLYCTNRCDGVCTFCEATRSPTKGDADPYKTLCNIREFKELGGWYIDLTGGNPLLVPWLRDALSLCRTLGLMSSLTISGPMISRRLQDWGKDWIALPYILRFSIDGNETFHNSNRGNGWYEHSREGMKQAQSLRQGMRTQILFTVVPGMDGNLNRDQFACVLTLAREFNVLVNVNLVFNITDLSSQEITDLRWFGRQADVQLSRGKLRFIVKGGNNTKNPTCRAASDVATISTDHRLMLPCFHQAVRGIEIEASLRRALDSHERREAMQSQGRYQSCQACSRWCYIIPSFLGHWMNRVVAWEHSLSVLQRLRDPILKAAGRLHTNSTYPDFYY